MEDKTMATTTPTPLPEGLVSAPEAPGPRKLRRFPTHRGLLTWAGVLAAIAAAVALAVVTLTGGHDDTTPIIGAHTGQIEHGSIRSIEGSVEDSVVDPLAGGDDTGLIEHGSIRSIEGSVEDSVADPLASGDDTGLIERGSISSIEGSVEDRSSS
jgi:hypothetical protein